MNLLLSRAKLHRGVSLHHRFLSNVIVEFPTPEVAHLTLNREAGKNSLSKAFRNELNDAVKSLHDNKSLRALVVKSGVAKVFCAGADLKERATMNEDEVNAFVCTLRELMSNVAALPFPTVAAIEGAALGGGLELALACDLRVAGSDSILGLPETALAIIPAAGGSQRLPRLIGIPKAKELIFTAKRLNSVQAEAIGLITEAVPAGQAASRAHEIALGIAEKGPIGLRMAKRAIDEGMQHSLEQGLEVEKDCYSVVVATSDRREGLKAFNEKRKPVYRGE